MEVMKASLTPVFSEPNESTLSEQKALWKSVFGDSEAFISDFFSIAYSARRSAVAILGGRVVAMLYWFDCVLGGERLAYIYAVATAAEHRGLGICTGLMRYTHRRLSALGYSGAVLCPASDSLFGFYRRLGYTSVTSVGVISASAREKPVSVTRITSDEYGSLRRRYIPAGGVLQEGVSLEFLSAQAELYKGEDFLLAAREESGSLLGLELLGNADKASGILCSLGYRKGSFRSPSAPEKKPFAAFIPLKENAAAPAYFGIAFD